MSPKAHNETEKNARGPPWRSVFAHCPFSPCFSGGCSIYRIWAQGELTIFTSSTSAAAIGNLDRAKEETRAAGSG